MTAEMKHVQVLHPQGIEMVHKVAGRNIIGFDGNVEWIRDYNNRQQDKLDRLFEGVSEPPAASTVLALTDTTGSELYGAAIVETPYFDELVNENEEQARTMASFHRVLAGMFVAEEFRGQGLGLDLLDWAANHTFQQRARYLDGFVDERTGAADFYRRFGATMTERNQGLPVRSPANVPLNHVKKVNGHWFYIDTWPMFEELLRCSRCEERLRFVAEDGGRLVCDVCGDPKDLVDR